MFKSIMLGTSAISFAADRGGSRGGKTPTKAEIKAAADRAAKGKDKEGAKPEAETYQPENDIATVRAVFTEKAGRDIQLSDKVLDAVISVLASMGSDGRRCSRRFPEIGGSGSR